MTETRENLNATINACKLCTPLGACIVFRGIKNAMPIIHGSQGCSTYIRRYIISHFKEPMDIASSNFTENTTIFGGEINFINGIENVIRQYNPELVGVATSCLSETIGEDITIFIQKYLKKYEGKKIPEIIYVSTPSFRGTHINGFHRTVKTIVETLAQKNGRAIQINLFPGFVSPADIRYLKEIMKDFKLKYVMLPDYSETLDAPIWDKYKIIPEGGTPVNKIKTMGSSFASIEFGKSIPDNESAGLFLEYKFGIKRFNFNFPIGIKETDNFFKILEMLSGFKIPLKYKLERGRLIDSYIDAHKTFFDKKSIVYGELDLVIGITQFLLEIGIIPVLVATGEDGKDLTQFIKETAPQYKNIIKIKSGVDFAEIEKEAEHLEPDIIIGNSKGYKIAKKLSIPLVRIGFPIHDRIGGQRILHIGYRGTQNLFDTITNALIEYKQNNSSVGYSYM